MALAGPVPVPGLSRSSLSPGNLGASWRGVLRSEGGGFCGQRMRPCLVVSIVILWFEEYISKLLHIIYMYILRFWNAEPRQLRFSKPLNLSGAGKFLEAYLAVAQGTFN